MTQTTNFEGYTRVTEPLFFCSSIRAVDPAVLQRAANRGTRVHEVIAAMINGLGACITDDISGYIESYIKWGEKDSVIIPERCFCDEHKITGEADAIYKEGDKFILVDFKTPAKESSTWNLQLSAYAYLLRKSGYKIDAIEAVKLDKGGKSPKIYRYPDKFEQYLECLHVYRYFHEGKEPEDYLDYL